MIFLLMLFFFRGNAQLNSQSLKTSDDISYEGLHNGFVNPPQDAKLRCYWWWLNGIATKASITRDLEQMKAKGYGGASIVDAGNSDSKMIKNAKSGPVFMSPAWMELYKYAVKEAQRLGIDLSVNVQSGWNPGGPSITPEFALKKLVTTDTVVHGGQRITMTLPMPDTNLMYRDIIVQAIPKQDTGLPVRDKAIRNWSIKTFNGSLGWSGIYPLYKLRDGFFDSTKVNLIQRKSILNLNAYFDGKTLDWKAPAGDWVIIRYGWTCTGARTSTTSPGWGGLSLDHLNPQAFKLFSRTVIVPLIKAAQSVGNSLKFLQTDSWEMGNVNWTQNFPEDFLKLRGYDMMPFMPVLEGRVVESQQVSNRFLYDFRKTVGDCIAKYHYQLFADLAHQYGMGIHPESGGPHSAPIDALKVMAISDFPQGEFWAMSNTHRVSDADRFSVKQSASVAHTNGKRFVAAEGPTSIGPHWEKSPLVLKSDIDRVFCSGVNRIVWHTFTSSPKEFGQPGREYFAGTHLNPNVTWWKDAGTFINYLNRSSFLLQQGHFVADVLRYYGDDVPNFVFLKEEYKDLKFGYDWDKCSAEVLNKLTVQNGKLVLPDGMRYRVLVLPSEKFITLSVLRRIKALVKDGATILGPRPKGATGLLNYPESDKEVQKIASELWGKIDGNTIKENKFGKGTVVWGMPIDDLLDSMKIGTDFAYSNAANSAQLDYLHRRTKSADIYFISNKFLWNNYNDYKYRYLPEKPDRFVYVACKFRVTGKKPQLWDPVTGKVSDIVNYSVDDRQTIIPLYLKPGQSVFVVFSGQIQKDKQVVSIMQNGHNQITPGSQQPNGISAWPPIELEKRGEQIQADIYEPGKYVLTNGNSKQALVRSTDTRSMQKITGTWHLKFDGSGQNVPDTNINNLQSWTKFSNEAIKYFSGTVQYVNEFQMKSIENRKYVLDLGNVQDLASVTVNGKPLGVLWTAPFKIDITSVIRPGTNTVKIGVTNLWANRLIGDGQLPENERHTQTNIKKFDEADAKKYLRVSGLMGPVQIIGIPQATVQFK